MAIRTAEGSHQEGPRLRGIATVGALLIVLTAVTLGLLERGVTVQTPWGSGFTVRITCYGLPNGGYEYLFGNGHSQTDIVSLGPCRCVFTHW